MTAVFSACLYLFGHLLPALLVSFAADWSYTFWCYLLCLVTCRCLVPSIALLHKLAALPAKLRRSHLYRKARYKTSILIPTARVQISATFAACAFPPSRRIRATALIHLVFGTFSLFETFHGHFQALRHFYHMFGVRRNAARTAPVLRDICLSLQRTVSVSTYHAASLKSASDKAFAFCTGNTLAAYHIALLDSVISNSLSPPSEPTGSVAPFPQLPLERISLPAPAAFDEFASPPHARGGGPPRTDTQLSALSRQAPIYQPIVIRGPNGTAFEAYAFIDTGSTLSFANTSFLQQLGTHSVSGNSMVSLANADVPAQHAMMTADFLDIWCKEYHCKTKLMVMPFSQQLQPHILIGRDLLYAFGIYLHGLSADFPNNSNKFEDQHDFVRPPRVFNDDDEITEHSSIAAVAAELKDLVDLNQTRVPRDSFINHPSAEVFILHGSDVKSPAYRRQYPDNNPQTCAAVKAQIEEWMETQRIVKWDPKIHGQWPRYNAPILPVVTYGSDGSVKKTRIVFDARQLNEGLVDNEAPLPAIPSIYNRMQGKRLFTELDLASAFLQFKVNPDHQHKLAFTWMGQTYCFSGAPFGLKHLSAHVQRVMEEIFHDMQDFCHVYIDNIIIASDTLEEHRAQVAAVIERCNQYLIRLSPSKCQLVKNSIKTLGSVISPSGVSADPDKLATVASWPIPKSRDELISFLSFTNYLRGHVRHYSSIAAPLDRLRSPTVDFAAGWTDTVQNHFDLLKTAISKCAKLNAPRADLDFALAVDASIYGIGACLFQPRFAGELPTPDNIISISSRSLHDYETRYSVYKLELNACCYFVELFSDYLSHRKFTLLTDHQALIHLHRQRDLHRTYRKWYAHLLEFDFDISHVPGHLNEIPDTLSRRYSASDIWGTSASPATASVNTIHIGNISVLAASAPPCPPDSTADVASAVPPASPPAPLAPLNPPATEAEQLELVRRIHSEGHFGQRAMHAALVRQHLLWPSMAKQIRSVCHSCSTCQAWTRTKRIFHPLRSVQACLPWDILEVDLITSFDEADGMKYILTVVDVFTSFCLLRTLPSRSTADISAALHQIFSDMGTPRELRTDGEAGIINSASMAQFLADHNVKHTASLPHVHHSNGKVERMNGTVSDCLRKFMRETGKSWPTLLPLVQSFINKKHRDATNSSPFALVFNRTSNHLVPYARVHMPTDADVDSWLQSQKYLHEQIFPVIRESISANQDEYLVAFNSQRNVVSAHIPTGTIVMLHDIMRSSKNDPPWLGPYTVVRVTPLGHYTLRDMANGIHHHDVTRDRLKIVDSDELRATANESSYVSRILDHRSVKGEMQYLIAWADSSDNTWEPTSHIHDETLIKQYLSNLAQLPRSLKPHANSAEASSPAPPVSSRQRRNRSPPQQAPPAAAEPARTVSNAATDSHVGVARLARSRRPSSRALASLESR
jgi:transposase InsO family protein